MSHEIHSPLIFWIAAGLPVAYILYMMVRRRRGERPGAKDREPEL
jgi:hypothetical protein